MGNYWSDSGRLVIYKGNEMQIDGDFFLELSEFYSALMTSLIQYLIQYKIRLQPFSLNFLK